MTTKTFYRRANVPKENAVGALLMRTPGASLVGVQTKRATADEATSAGVRPGERIYAATIKLAEGNPFAEEGGGDAPDLTGDSPSEDKSSEDKGEDKSEKKDDSSDSDSGDKDSGGDAPEGLEGLGDEPEELTGEDKIIDLLQQLVDAVGGGAPLGPEAGAPDDLGLGGDPAADLGGGPALDIGAPSPGTALPPPVPEKAPAPAFASVRSRVAASGEAVLVRRDVTDEVTTTELIREAGEEFPAHRVAQVRRNGVAEIKGVKVDLPAHQIALVTLVRK
jgi:hypothetical protein